MQRGRLRKYDREREYLMRTYSAFHERSILSAVLNKLRTFQSNNNVSTMLEAKKHGKNQICVTYSSTSARKFRAMLFMLSNIGSTISG